MRLVVLTATALALSACSSQESDAATAATDSAAADPADESSETSAESGGRTQRYTSLADCEVVREELEEMPFVETLCPGPARWALRVTDSDARQNLLVVPPDGREASIERAATGMYRMRVRVPRAS